MKIDKIPDSIDPALDLEIIRAECLELVQKRAYISAGAARADTGPETALGAI